MLRHTGKRQTETKQTEGNWERQQFGEARQREDAKTHRKEAHKN